MLSAKVSELAVPNRRTSLMIMMELLKNIDEPIKLTHVLYRTNLSYLRVRKYLDLLITMELAKEVVEEHRVFVITEKGKHFLRIFASTQS